MNDTTSPPNDTTPPLGKRAARREAKLKAAEVLQNLIMDGEFEESAKPLIWNFIDGLRKQKKKRNAAALTPPVAPDPPT